MSITPSPVEGASGSSAVNTSTTADNASASAIDDTAPAARSDAHTEQHGHTDGHTDGHTGDAEGQSGGRTWLRWLGYLALYFLISSVIKLLSGPAIRKDARGHVLPNIRPVWRQGDRFSLSVYLSDESKFHPDRNPEDGLLVWHQPELTFDWAAEGVDTVSHNISVPASLMHAAATENRTLYAHCWATRGGRVFSDALWQDMHARGVGWRADGSFVHIPLTAAGHMLTEGPSEGSDGAGHDTPTDSADDAVAAVPGAGSTGLLQQQQQHRPMPDEDARVSTLSRTARRRLVSYFQLPATVHRPVKVVRATKNLLSFDDGIDAEGGQRGGATQELHTQHQDTALPSHSTAVASASSSAVSTDVGDTGSRSPPVIHLRPRLAVRMLIDHSEYGVIPNELVGAVKLNRKRTHYFPHGYFDTFWDTTDELVPLNASYAQELYETQRSHWMTVSYAPVSLWKWRLQESMVESWETQQRLGLQEGDKDTDLLKRMLLDTNIYLLGTTVVVSLLHTVFDMLAFKNDIQYWRKRSKDKNMQGVSVRSIFISLFCQLVIFLYLLDSDKTSWMIMISQGLGLAIAVWKVGHAVKSFRFGCFRQAPFFFTWEDHESATLSQTAQHDRQAIRYLSYVLYPLVVGYAIYSLVYEEHASWYSWAMGSLVGAVYTFGFILMCPQLYVNYKMQSVAHLNWRMMTYKALNTVIDDLFAFIIEMPTMHRLSCFRDDIVFGIFLLQMWWYKTDKTRVNEFGVAEEGDADESTGTDGVEGNGGAVIEGAAGGVEGNGGAVIEGAAGGDGSEAKHVDETSNTNDDGKEDANAEKAATDNSRGTAVGGGGGPAGPQQECVADPAAASAREALSQTTENEEAVLRRRH